MMIAKRIEFTVTNKQGRTIDRFWDNGIGYTQEQLDEALTKLNKDPRVTNIKVIER